jgi:leucyl-tRNA synthetase
MDLKAMEEKWQKEWWKARINEGEIDPSKPKYYLIFAYPGVSGPQHVGHMRGYTYSDVITRYKRMKGFSVLFPAGFHASGISAVAYAKKVADNHAETIEYLKRNGVSQKDVESFKDYKAFLSYWYKAYENEYWRRFGFLIDYRRLTSTLFPGYAKFIQWQFRKLHQAGLLVQKPNYSAYCPKDGPIAVDASETDIKRGGKAEKIEFTLLKFRFGDEYLVAATLRPETVYGQTNMWVRPDVDYVRAKLDGQVWIVSKECADNLRHQGRDISVVGKVRGSELVGKKCVAPGVEREIPILPSSFPDPAVGTGLVTSVPSDAPYDYIALMDLKKTHPSLAAGIELIPIIESKGYGTFPAKEICERMGIRDQGEIEKLEEATAEIYKVGFHTGRMITGPYKGQRVTDAKDLMKEDLIRQGKADTMWSFSEPVVCRCGENVVVKKFDNQWFIKYSDRDLTDKSKDYAPGMSIYPKEYKDELPGVLDWFDDRPCARQGSWLGTKFPLDESWIIEPISDSTLYPMYYIVSLYENSGKIKPEEMTDAFFDYVFLGAGAPARVEWARVRKDFEYWYPLDINLGGKEHKTVHFPVFLMNHVAVLPGTLWPKGIFVNWWVTGGAGKISKSKGGAEPIPEAIEKYSVDAMRLYYCHIAQSFLDIEWEPEMVLKYKDSLNRSYLLAESLLAAEDARSLVDAWVELNFNKRLERASLAMEEYDFRTAADEVFFGVARDLQWYKRRGGANRDLLKELLGKWFRLWAPFAPHLAEEAWHSLLGHKGLVSVEKWPALFATKADESVNTGEELVERVLSDIRAVEKIRGKKAGKVFVYVAAPWKWRALSHVVEAAGSFGDAMKKAAADSALKQHAKDLPSLVKRLCGKFALYRESKAVDEFVVLDSAVGFLSAELGAGVELFREESPGEDAGHKANAALPLYPGIFVA